MSSFLSNKTLLVPYDFSDESSAAVGEAVAMADDSTKIHLLHVLVPIDVISMEPGFYVDLGSETQRVDDLVRTMKEKVAIDRESVKFVGRIGDPGTEIVQYAAEIGADLIVMPSHGRTGFKRLLLGSVAERVVRLAECPVMVLRGAKKSE